MQISIIFLTMMVPGFMAMPSRLHGSRPTNKHTTSDRVSQILEKFHSDNNISVLDKEINGTRVSEQSIVNKGEGNVLQLETIANQQLVMHGRQLPS
ncbi:putative secreted effector protein [Blumeria graminis f. sp. tritici 96224]|uniref:BgtE-5564 n=1 Tax=Blumeria graminis f. sp. tritici 96224 TaxID=1268274 RepID=A0A381L709_BLUGR|nr:putative secreted effector protein [Blumeria graminis f. sp. tritici 96224]